MKLHHFINITIEGDSEYNILNSFKQSLIQAQDYYRDRKQSQGCEFPSDYLGKANAVVSVRYYDSVNDDIRFDLFIDFGIATIACLSFDKEEDLWNSSKELEESLKEIINAYFFE